MAGDPGQPGDRAGRSAVLDEVLRSAARLQAVVPDAVLVGGVAAALYAGHRDSFDHDHVLTDLARRYFDVLEAVEASDGWATSVRASRPPVTIMGSLGGVEAGLRQLRRTRPLETVVIDLGEGLQVRVPTEAEVLRVKAYLVVARNVVRDYLDVVALADHLGPTTAAPILRAIDDYYDDRSATEGSVRTALALRLARPEPRDPAVTRELPSYKGLLPKWHSWPAVVAACRALALAIAEDSS